MKFSLNTNWQKFIDELCVKHNSFFSVLEKEYQTKTIYPKKELIFNCFNFFNEAELKVVIFGQDPYHNPNEAMGLAFSIANENKIPSSLRNIFKELKNDLNIERNQSDLSGWASQGVLLLNTILTVEKNKPLSHDKLGWDVLINDIIKYINLKHPDTIFILMGNNAKKKYELIKNKKNIIMSAHPSGLSAHRGFFGSKIFSKTNFFLKHQGKNEIKW